MNKLGIWEIDLSESPGEGQGVIDQLVNIGTRLNSVVVKLDSSLTNLIGSGDMRNVVATALPQKTQGFELTLVKVGQNLNAVVKLLIHTQRLPELNGVCQSEKI